MLYIGFLRVPPCQSFTEVMDLEWISHIHYVVPLRVFTVGLGTFVPATLRVRAHHGARARTASARPTNEKDLTERQTLRSAHEIQPASSLRNARPLQRGR